MTDKEWKECPFCIEQIHVRAIICKHCLSILDPQKYKTLSAKLANSVNIQADKIGFQDSNIAGRDINIDQRVDTLTPDQQYRIALDYAQNPQSLRAFDLSGRDLSDVLLREADLQRATLKKTDFTRANLTDANLTKTDLTDARLNDVDGYRAQFIEATLFGADLTGAKLKGAVFTGARYNGLTKWAVGINPETEGAVLEERIVSSQKLGGIAIRQTLAAHEHG